MSFLFGGSQPQPQAVPIAPSTDPDAEKRRQEAAQAAEIESKQNGRRATIAGGARSALESRQSRSEASRVLG